MDRTSGINSGWTSRVGLNCIGSSLFVRDASPFVGDATPCQVEPCFTQQCAISLVLATASWYHACSNYFRWPRKKHGSSFKGACLPQAPLAFLRLVVNLCPAFAGALRLPGQALEKTSRHQCPCRAQAVQCRGQ